MMPPFLTLAAEVGSTVIEKRYQYGDSATAAAKVLSVLYPGGARPYQYADMLLVTRIIDKLSRLAQRGPDGRDLGGESPYLDIAGYALIGLAQDRRGNE